MARTRADDEDAQRGVTASEAAQEQRAAEQEPTSPPVGPPSPPPAASYDLPAAPAEAGPGVQHPDGSVAPAEDAEPIGTTRYVE